MGVVIKNIPTLPYVRESAAINLEVRNGSGAMEFILGRTNFTYNATPEETY